MSSPVPVGDPVFGVKIFPTTHPPHLPLTHRGPWTFVLTLLDLSFPVCKLELSVLKHFKALLCLLNLLSRERGAA